MWLSSRNIKSDGSPKLQPRFLGPFEVVQILNLVSLKLALPPELPIHPVFHVSLLKPYDPATRPAPPPPLVRVQSQEEYEVHRLLDSKRIDGVLHYLIDWKGYGPEEHSWGPAS